MRVVSPLQKNGHGYKRYDWLFLWDKMHSINEVISVLITGISGPLLAGITCTKVAVHR